MDRIKRVNVKLFHQNGRAHCPGHTHRILVHKNQNWSSIHACIGWVGMCVCCVPTSYTHWDYNWDFSACLPHHHDAARDPAVWWGAALACVFLSFWKNQRHRILMLSGVGCAVWCGWLFVNFVSWSAPMYRPFGCEPKTGWKSTVYTWNSEVTILIYPFIKIS